MSSDAKITIGVEGAETVKKAFDDLISNAKKVGGAVEDASKKTAGLGDSAKKAGSFWKDFGKDVASSLGTVATSALATVTAVNTISFAQAISSAKALDDTMARFATGSGRSIGGLRDQVRDLSRSTNTQEKDVLAWSKSIGRVTYDSKAAMNAYKAFADEALASNQDISEQGGLAEVFSNGLGVKGDDTQKFLDSLRGMSAAANNTGGFNAFKDQIQGLGGAMSTLSLKTDDSKREFLAFQAAIGKGQTPQQASRIQQGILGSIQGNAEGLARQFGANNVYDENGRVKDVPTLVSMIKKDLTKRYGKSARKVAMQSGNFGGEVGAAIFNFDEEAYRNIVNAGASKDGAADAYRNSAEGKRANADIRRDQNVEDAARKTFGVQDTLGDFYAEHPILGTLGAGAAGILGKAGLAAGGKGLMGLLSGGGSTAVAGGGTTAAGVGGIGLLGGVGLAAAGILGSLGALTATTAPLNQNMGAIRQETQDQLEGHREGLARAVVAGVERGGAGGIEGVESALGPATLGAVKNDPVLASLLQQFENQSDTISGLPDNIAKAVADALKGSPVNVNVLNQTGSPIHGVNEVQKKNSRQ